MEKEPTAFDLEPEKLGELLAVGSDVGDQLNEKGQGRDAARAEQLRRLLRQVLPPDRPAIEMLPEEMGKHRKTVCMLASDPICELLQDSRTDVALMRKIKDYGKTLSAQTNSKAEHDAANAIYYAAIAHSLLYCKRKITKYSYDKLTESLRTWSKKTWVPQGLRKLFTEASQFCEGRTESRP